MLIDTCCCRASNFSNACIHLQWRYMYFTWDQLSTFHIQCTYVYS